jgi:hypothetical protein
VSHCRFYSDVYHAVERTGVDPAVALEGMNGNMRRKADSSNGTLGVMTHVMDLIGNPPSRFRRAHEKIVEAFGAYGQLDALAGTPPSDMPAREASLADLHNRFTASMGEMRALIRTSE